MFGVLTAYSLWTGISFPNSGKLFVKILLKMFSKPLEWDFSPSPPIICWFDLFRGFCASWNPHCYSLLSLWCWMAPAPPACLQAWYSTLWPIVLLRFPRVLNLTYWYFLFLPSEIAFSSDLGLCWSHASCHQHLLNSVHRFDFFSISCSSSSLISLNILIVIILISLLWISSNSFSLEAITAGLVLSGGVMLS